MNKACFLDRDDTLIFDIAQDPDPMLVDFIPGVIEGLKKLQNNDFKVVICTNQGGPLSYGNSSVSKINAVHDELIKQAEQKGVYIDDIYYCPHYPDGVCGCRKPQTGMIISACKDYDINVSESFFVGDRKSDVECGQNAGCKASILLSNTYHYEEVVDEMLKEGIRPDYVADDFEDAVGYILKMEQ